MMHQKFLRVGVALVVATAITGCGGGGGGANIGRGDVPQDLSEGLTRSGPRGITVVNKAARSEPRAGSVMQSSNTDSRNVTRDEMDVTVGYANGRVTFVGTYDENGDGTPDVRIGTADADFTDSFRSDEDICAGCTNRARFAGRKWQGAFLGKQLAGERFLVAVYTDLQPGDPSRTDYMAGGIWLSVPENATSIDDLRFGAFADASDPFLQASMASLTGTATYQGDALGIYNDSEDIGEFYANVRLTADFGDGSALGTVRGSVFNFSLGDGTSAPLQELTLGAASLTDAEGGFFKGTTSGTGLNGNYSGRWGGQFAGNGAGHPSSVGGTFGGARSDDRVNFVGSFGAYRQ